MKKTTPLLISLSLILTATACLTGLSGIPTPIPPPNTPDVVLTSLVQTLTAIPAANLTAAAQATSAAATPIISATPLPSNTPVPSLTPIPSFTPIFTDTTTPSETPGTPTVDYACQLVSQKPELGAVYTPKHSLDSIWNVKNTGSETWNIGEVVLKYISGAKLQTKQKTYDLKADVVFDDTIDVAADMVTPKEPGYYKATWGLSRVADDNVFCTLTVFIVVQ